MKTIKQIILTAAFCLIAVVANAQVSARYEVRNGSIYAVITNNGSTTVNVAYRCVNYQLGQWRDGAVTLRPGYETCIGPNIGWVWQYGEELLWQVDGYKYNISFKGKPCTATVGCDCKGFKPKSTVGPERFICDRCKHEKKYHPGA